MRARDDVGGNQLTDAICSLCTGFNSSLYTADISLNQNGQETAADGDLLDEVTDAAFAIASLASIEPVRPLVSINPMDSLMIFVGLGCVLN